MKKYKLNSNHKKIIADTLTPVSAYLKLRDIFPNSILLESSDYDGRTNNYSYICCNPISTISIKNNDLKITYPDGKNIIKKNLNNDQVTREIESFSNRFDCKKYNYKFITNGLFGYIAHEAVSYFEKIKFNKKKKNLEIPDIYYAVYKNIIAISLFSHEAYIFSHNFKNDDNLNQIEKILKTEKTTKYDFKIRGREFSNLTDKEFLDFVHKGKKHCYRGDVFQIVLSRRFSQGFTGDEFNVYRALRSINPSPYLFFFDYGNFKIFGSSPEAQLIIENKKAEIHPIAGTYKRTGDDKKDKETAIKLSKDPKENSEHVMLVDLARNDLSRNGTNVVVEKNREIQFFSHVIHLVSKVTGKINKNSKTFQVVADTFPAGTLSGAPKHKALELIDLYEKTARNFYGGAVGYMDFYGNFNHAIIIRSFLSKDKNLYYQAGAGIVSDSIPEKELQEVYNKLGALNKALIFAEKL